MEIKLTRWFVYEWGKPTWQKPYRMILRSPLPRIHYYHNKQLQYPTYIWTCSVVTISHFHCVDPSIRLTNCANPSTRLQSPIREGCWLQSSLVHHMMKIKKLLGHKPLWCTNTAASSRERWTRENSVSDHNLHEQTLLHTCATCVTFDSPQNNPYICLGLW